MANGSPRSPRCAAAQRVLGNLEAVAVFDATQHIATNQQLVLHSDRVTMRSNYLAALIRHGIPGGATFLLAGTYDDRRVRGEDGVWRFARRTIHVTWTMGNLAVMVRDTANAMQGNRP